MRVTAGDTAGDSCRVRVTAGDTAGDSCNVRVTAGDTAGDSCHVRVTLGDSCYVRVTAGDSCRCFHVMSFERQVTSLLCCCYKNTSGHILFCCAFSDSARVNLTVTDSPNGNTRPPHTTRPGRKWKISAADIMHTINARSAKQGRWPQTGWSDR